MKLFNNYKLLFFFLLIVNTIISVFLYSIFDSHSYKGPTRVFQNIYEVSVERNFEFSDLDLLTSKTCFSNCKYFEKNVGNIYFKILQDLANQTKYKRTFEYKVGFKQDFNEIFNNKIIIEQIICINEDDCKNEANEIFNDSIEKFRIYLNVHVDELIGLIQYYKDNEIYNLSQESKSNNNDYNRRLEEIATKIIINDTTAITEREAVGKAQNILEVINESKKTDLDYSSIDEYLEELLVALKNFKINRISKFPSYYNLELVEIKNLGLKESPYRQIYYNIPNYLKSMIIFIIIFIVLTYLIRIIDKYRNPQNYF